MPSRHEHVVVARPLQPGAGGGVLPQRFVQRQRRGVPAEERERGLVRVDGEQIALVDVVADVAQPVPLNQAVLAEAALASFERAVAIAPNDQQTARMLDTLKKKP